MIGKEATKVKLNVREVYTREPITAAPHLPASEARKLMDEHDIRRLPVVQDDKLVGIVTLLDLIQAAPASATSLSEWELEDALSEVTVEQAMTRDVHTASEDTDLRTVAALMLEYKIGGVPVVEGERVIGIVTESDIFRVLVDLLQDEVK